MSDIEKFVDAEQLAAQTNSEGNERAPNPKRWFWTAIIFNVTATIILFIVCRWWIGLPDHPDEGTKAFITAMLAIFALNVITYQAYVYARQSHTMREGLSKTENLLGQNERIIAEMKGQRGLVEQQILLVDRQSVIARNQTIEMIGQREVMQDGLEQNAKMIAAAKSQANTAKKALKLSEDMFYISQRAYLAFEGPLVNDADFIEGSEFAEITVLIRNTGNTPAQNTAVTFAVGLVEVPLQRDRERPVFPDPQKIDFLLHKGMDPFKVSSRFRIGANIDVNFRWIIYVRLMYNCLPGRTVTEMYAFLYHPEGTHKFMIVEP
jgi:hypothetical protein